MSCDPTESAEVVNVEVVPAIISVPSTVVPSMKVTVPVLPAISVAVKVTDCRYEDGLTEDVSKTGVTVTDKLFEVLDS